MYTYRIETDRCKGCGLCVAVCPKNVLAISDEINTSGYYPVCQTQPEKCVFCGTCCLMCPDVAITIVEVTKENS